jgi:hypothetical protein
MTVSHEDGVRADAGHPAEPIFTTVYHEPALAAGKERGCVPAVKPALHVDVAACAEKADVYRGAHLIGFLPWIDVRSRCKAHANIRQYSGFLAQDVPWCDS